MATLAENAAAIKAAQVAIDAAIVDKGGTTTGGLSNAAAGIATIPSGGDGWVRPAGWADLEAIVAANQREGYLGSVGLLVDNSKDEFTIPLSVNAVMFSDGEFRTTTAKKTWNDGARKDDEEHLSRWVILYYTSENVKLSIADRSDIRCVVGSESTILKNLNIRNVSPRVCKVEFVKAKELVFDHGDGSVGYNMQSYGLKEVKAEKLTFIGVCDSVFADCQSLTKIPELIDVQNCTRARSLFYDCGIRTFGDLNLKNCTNSTTLFSSCRMLKKVGDIEFGEGCVADLMFANCRFARFKSIDFSKLSSAKEFFSSNSLALSFPDVIDLRGITSSANLGDYWFSRYSCGLRRFPTHVYANVNLKMNAVQIEANGFMPESIAEFDDGGDVVGGMVYNLNENTTGSSLTLTLPASLKTLYSSAELTKIGDLLTSKGWTLVW